MSRQHVPLSPYLAPPRTLNAAGEPRKVGLEIELANLSMEQVLELLASVVGGTPEAEGPTLGRVVATRFGTFKVEYDWKALKERRYMRPLEQLGVDPDSGAAQLYEESVLRVAKEFVPTEIVSPPIPWSRLGELDALWPALRAAGGEGTRDSVLYAFGLHLNPELPNLEVSTVLDYLRAFLLLEEWIRDVADIDLARRFSPFIRAFPASYLQLALEPSYRPDWRTFIDDYITHNPTRNRSLDLLPLFRHVEPELDLEGRDVERFDLVQGRPTFHYRLPNSEITRPGWSPAIDWNRWVVVERLAERKDMLAILSEDYLEAASGEGPAGNEPWIRHLRTRLPALEEPMSHAS
jgi:hypothetical protein